MKEAKPITNGDWWTADKGSWVKCYLCGRLHRMRATVIHYVPDMDYVHEWPRKFPGVEVKGWVLWGWCTKRRKEYFETVTWGAVRRWDTAAGGKWHITSPRQKGYLPDE